MCRFSFFTKSDALLIICSKVYMILFPQIRVVPWLFVCCIVHVCNNCEYYCTVEVVSFEGRQYVCSVLIYDTILILVILIGVLL